MEESFLQVVDNLLQVGRNDEAIKQCLQWLASDPSHYLARTCLIRAHMQKGEYDKADQAATALIKLAPDEPFAYFLKSIACHAQNKFNSELAMAEQAARLEPEEPDYLQRLAEAQLQQGLVKKAKETSQQLLKIAPDSEEAHELLGRICLEIEDYPTAEQHYRSALRFDPTARHLLNNLAVVLQRQKKGEEAIAVLFNALKLEPNDETLRYNTFEFIKAYLDKHTFKGKRKQALESLPTAVQMFYQDMKQRSSHFEKYSRHTLTFMWLGFLIAFAAVIAWMA